MTTQAETAVSSLAEALAALAASNGAATLVGDAASGGGGWFRALIEAARRDYPEVTVTALLECHDRPGLVLAGIRAGCRDLRFSGPSEVAARLAALAAAAGARLHPGGGDTSFPA